VNAVERRAGLTADEFHAGYLHPELPVVLTDQQDGWPAAARWSNEDLIERFGDRPVRAYHHPEGLYTAWKRMRVDTTLGAILASQDPRTFASSDLLPECPYLVEEIGIPRVLRPEWVIDEATLWVQPRGNRTGLHWDTYNSVISVVRGEKRVLLFSPDQFELLYPCAVTGSADFTRASWSRVDIFAPDHDAFPALRQARCVEVIVRAGETLLIPRHWWHAVENRGTPTIAVSYFVAPQGRPELTFFADRRVVAGMAVRLGLSAPSPVGD